MDAEIGEKFSLAGRVAVITGAASGIGREVGCLFARAGAGVLLADIDIAGLEATAAEIRAAGGTATIRRTDVAERDSVEALAAAAMQMHGRLDGWVNSAGIPLWSGISEVEPKAAERLVAINMMGTYWGVAAAGRAMAAQKRGAIVNVSSTAGDSPVPGLSVYGMAKAGVNQLARVAALEFGPHGVRVNNVVPGWIDTPINASQYHDAAGKADAGRRAQVLAQMEKLSPLGLTGAPMDIALAILYLVSDASRFVTGQALRVSGGV